VKVVLPVGSSILDHSSGWRNGELMQQLTTRPRPYFKVFQILKKKTISDLVAARVTLLKWPIKAISV
jgi:hypothetical protein